MSDPLPAELEGTFGFRLRRYMADEYGRNGGKMTPEQWIRAVNTFESAERALNGSKRKKKAVLVSELFLSICAVCSIKTEEVPRSVKRSINHFISEIRDVCPDVTPQEIKLRADRYKRLHPTWTLSPASLHKHWGELHDPTSKIHSELDEPAGWREHMDEIFQPERDAGWEERSIESHKRLTWAEHSTEYKRKIIRRFDVIKKRVAQTRLPYAS